MKIVETNKDTIDAMIDYSRDFLFDYFCKIEFNFKIDRSSISREPASDQASRESMCQLRQAQDRVIA